MWYLLLVPFFIANGFIFPMKHFSYQYSLSARKPSHDNYENNRYPFSKKYYKRALKRLNSENNTNSQEVILGYDSFDDEEQDGEVNIIDIPYTKNKTVSKNILNGIQIIINSNDLSDLGFPIGDESDDEDEFRKIFGMNKEEQEEEQEYRKESRRKEYRNSFSESTTKKSKKSENFEVLTNSGVCFADIGGYDSIKSELNQCVDMLKNSEKYAKFNVRIPKGLVFEGPPGNGKTLIAKALATEANTSFIPVSGAEFQEKYVGVGASRIRELFQLASKNKPCIIFIDEIDAVGRKRSGDGESSTSERDSTLNELLVCLDGFKNSTGVFLVGATNRIDLLDSALMRPGRVDKKIFIGLPDDKTREAIINIHITGKPCDHSVLRTELIEQTNGLSGAQIENLLNEAMLFAIRENREEFNRNDFEVVYNKMMVGWQNSDHQISDEMIRQIAIHEMGHVVAGLVSKNHANISKVMINLSSPNTPAYTVFESSNSILYTKESLFEHLVILLAGRIAEEVFYGESITTGAINDFEEALKLAEKMIVYYGMGNQIIYPNKSDKYKELIDEQVFKLINKAYIKAKKIVCDSKEFVLEGAIILQKQKIIRADELKQLFILSLM